MKYALLIIGPPGSGKTTLTRNLIKHLASVATKSRSDTATKMVPYRCFDLAESQWKVIGVFSPKPTTYAEGTDKLSMGVQPKFEAFLKTNAASLIIEGDRLANVKTLEALERTGHSVRVLELKVDDQTLASRYRERGSIQSPTFIKGRKTKVKNLMERCREHGIRTRSAFNRTQSESNFIQHMLQKLMR